ncbi:hypothetical protein MKQ68_20395 [Chitinophaga horti]|uniref:DNA mismatch repair proteins mutS family domain-containing protein n=1 Tax=Chitinophaga horti TaxID=2920382 RepID=A0ABY6J2Q6_9BACT|nr:hypothetical protein [Chitinophaga horti]UYQ92447.1 hypothetical protein MKQ68_20395 [Chitinophaga horti]
MNPAHTYQQKTQHFGQQIKQFEGQLRLLSWGRLLCFLLMITAGYEYVHHDFNGIWLLVILGLVVLFIFSLVRYQRTQDKLLLSKTLLDLNEKELLLATKHVATFPDGAEFQDEQHDFAGDLDVFGPSSVFQHINRTGTLMGKRALADALKRSSNSVESVHQLQAAVKELAPQLDFRQLYAAQAIMAQEKEDDVAALRKWFDMPLQFAGKTGLRIASYLLPVLLIASFVYYGITGSYLPSSLLLIINGLMIGSAVKKVNEMYTHLGNKERILHKFANMLQQVRESPWQSAQLKQYKTTAEEADLALRQLAKTGNLLDQRLNILVAVFVNLLFLYDLHCAFAMERWKERYKTRVPDWLDVIAKLEVRNSFATFAYNHPNYIYPHVEDSPVTVSGTAIGHPLIPAAECVTNDVKMGEGAQFLIITGSNMSGKSTFLRSVGVNLLLATQGAPVCATTFNCSPCRIMTSMRIKDSIARHTSYFQAELLRLQHIIRVLKTGERAFIILDEILKGTNSEDKLTGSIRLIKHFLQYNCLGMIATHDLELGALEAQHPGYIRNCCFESSLENGDLHFDYRMREGIARNKNATFLMQQMEII